MSVQYGIWNQKGAPLYPAQLAKARLALTPYAPDGVECHSHESIAFLFCPLHGALESSREQRSIVSHAGIVLTWDGRLDNRTDLLLLLADSLRDDTSNAAIALAAYERWGSNGFVHLLGDWSIVIQDQANGATVLASDFAGVRPLYYSVQRGHVFWSSRLQSVVDATGISELDEQYIGGLFKGTMNIINEPDEKQLGIYSQAVYNNTPYTKERETLSKGEAGNPIPMKLGAASPIKHVFYIIKENRTYDQVLGDIKEGNGDASLVLFGVHITPNLHALAKEFVLLDNFYCDGEVSADGHEWSMGAYATDYMEKHWPTSYGGRGGDYDGEGTRAIANNKAYIWDQCKRSGISYRTYGEFTDGTNASIPVLEGHFCPYYTGWDLSVRDTSRFYQWKKEFDSLLTRNAVPQFNSIRFGNDHTEGLRKGKPTPFAHVADNDWAVGLFIEYLSKSSIWNESVVFIIEDDAQNGSDHVDAHRTTAYVAGGFVKRKFIDHTMYSTSSMLRTMELILGIPPMSQYDAAAEPMWRCFTTKDDLSAFHSLPPNINLNEKNVAVNEWQRLSEKFNFAKEDAIPDMEFNRVLWYGIKGNDVPIPAPRRAAFLKVKNNEEQDDD